MSASKLKEKETKEKREVIGEGEGGGERCADLRADVLQKRDCHCHIHLGHKDLGTHRIYLCRLSEQV